jgi:DNA-binding LacI/PurR family transcriptional regulator/sugar diacid utilization regulator
MITSHDVAKKAGVSQATVSRALRDQRGVSADTRFRVRAAAHELGYVPIPTGRAATRPRPRKVGVVSASLANPFYPALIGPLQEALRTRDLQTILITEPEDELLESGLLMDGSLDGVILTTSSVSSSLPGELGSRGIPFVLANRTVDDVEADMCTVDNEEGAAAVADLLIELGHERIGAIMGPENSSTGRERAAGFTRRLEELGSPLSPRLTVTGPFDPTTGRAGIESILRADAVPPSAVFCGNDVIALGVLDAAASLGVRVPEDLTVVGFDDIPSASWGTVGLTTVRVELGEMAEAVANALADRLEDPALPVRRTILTPRIVARSTHATARPASLVEPRGAVDAPLAQLLRPWMSALDGVARAVNAGHQRDTVLKSIAGKACELLGFDFCAVMLADRDDRLSVAGFDGLDARYLALVSDEGALQIHPQGAESDSPAARAYREQRTVAVPDTASATVYGRLGDLAPAQGYRSLLATPLREGGRVTGLLVGYLEEPHPFSAAEVELVELLAEQASVVLHAAGLRVAQQQVIDDLRATNDQLREAREQIEWAETQHQRLMQLVLDDGGLAGLSRALSDAVGASIAVEVEDGRVLHFVDARTDGDQELIVPIVLRGTQVGRLRITDLAEAPTPLLRRSIERFALVVGVELLQRRHLLEVRERLSVDLLTDLLRPDGPSQGDAVVERAAALGAELERPHTLVVVAPGKGARLRDVAAACHTAFRETTALVGNHEGRVVLLLRNPGASRAAVAAAWRRVASQGLAKGAVVVRGQRVDDVTGYARAYRVARGAADLRAGESSGLVDVEDLGMLALLLGDTPSSDLVQFADGVLGRLSREATAGSNALTETLRTWMDQEGSTTSAAEALGVHANTVTNRLRRVTELLGRDVQSTAARMDLQLAFAVDDVMGRQR